jgi:hypothetical protein
VCRRGGRLESGCCRSSVQRTSRCVSCAGVHQTLPPTALRGHISGYNLPFAFLRVRLSVGIQRLWGMAVPHYFAWCGGQPWGRPLCSVQCWGAWFWTFQQARSRVIMGVAKAEIPVLGDDERCPPHLTFSPAHLRLVEDCYLFLTSPPAHTEACVPPRRPWPTCRSQGTSAWRSRRTRRPSWAGSDVS